MTIQFKKDSKTQNMDFMLTNPIPKVVIKMAIPTVISMLVMSVYSLADMFFVSRLGTSASAAVGIVFSIMTMIQAVGFMLGVGAGSLISRSLGAGNSENPAKIASVAFFSSIVGGFFVLILGITFKTEIMKFLGATPTIIPYAEDFSHYILIASPVMCASFVLNILLRTQGKPELSMIGLAIGGILNIILDPILIFGLKMGIGGAAIATLISQTLSFLLLLLFYIKRKTNAQIKISLFLGNIKEWFPKICLNGGSSLIRQGFVVIANVLLNIHASKFGDGAVAGISITNRVVLVILSIMFGIGQGFQPVAGFCYGAKRHDRVKKAYIFTFLLSTVIQVIFAFLFYRFASEIVEIFQKNPEVVKIGSAAIKFFSLSLPFLPLSVITNMLFQVSGRPKESLFLSSCRQGIFFIPLIFILPRVLGITGLEICQPIANILSALISIPFLVKYFQDVKKKK